MTLRFLKPIYLAWTVPLLALLLVYQAIGLPHAIWSYSWIDNGHGINLSVPRVYTRCCYIGPYGEFNVAAVRGHCGWVRFFKEGAPQ